MSYRGDLPFKNGSADLVGVVFGEFEVSNQEAHVNRAIKGVEQQVEIGVRRKFTAINAPLQRLVGLPALGPQEFFAKGLDEFGIGLTSGEEGGNDLAAWRLKEPDHAPHLEAHIATQGAGVRELEFLLDADRESVGDQRRLGGPPAVHGCFADVGVGGHGLNAKIGESALLAQEFQRTAEDSLARLLAARATRRTLPVGSVVGDDSSSVT